MDRPLHIPPRRPPTFKTPEEGIEYTEHIRVFCQEPLCVWARETDWDHVDTVLVEAKEHWRHLHGVNLPKED